MPEEMQSQYDVIVIGGALSGAATAILLLREDPSLKVLIIEKSAAFGRRVGEATVEVSCYFLCRVLGLTQYLNEAHLVKQGMRFWFANAQTKSLPECTEIGGRYLSRVASFQVDRAMLDEEVLSRAAKAGAEVWRSATVGRVSLCSGGRQTVEVRRGDEKLKLSARWVVDASGFAAVLARQEGWLRQNTDHPTAAVWARWTGVKDWDSYELAQKYPEWAMPCYGIRNTATNHIIGEGWWAWCIPLKGGDVSIGVVFDQRLMKWPEEGSLGQRLKDFLMRHPATREIMADAQWREGDVHWRKNLPYYSTTFAGDGFVLVGDAAGFIDPFYSPGMDWIAFTSWSAAHLILKQRKGEDIAMQVDKHNRDFARSYKRWFEAIYQNKYEYMCEFDLMRVGFLLDLGFYYGGVASQPYKRGTISFFEPLFSTGPSVPFYWLMRTYNNRLAKIARRRRLKGQLGRRNVPKRMLVPGFNFSRSEMLPVCKNLAAWGLLELREGWKTWFRTVPMERSESSGSSVPMTHRDQNAAQPVPGHP
jgi:flavin-dependent dehydrogenase